MIFQILLFALINSVSSKIGQQKPLFKMNFSRKLSKCGSDSLFQSYEATSISNAPSMDGQDITVTAKVSPNPLAACTMMICDDDTDPCCNSCTSGLLIGGMLLDSPDLVCSGTNCDYIDQCTYSEGDLITVHGTVSGSTIKVDGHCLIGTQMGAMESCGQPRNRYTEVEAASIGPNMAGQNVMVTTSIQTADFAACTRMGCPIENLCCNSCHADPFIGGVNNLYLIESNGNKLGCQGNECDWEDNCLYSSSDIVTIYGTVGENGNIINIHDYCKVA